MLKHELLPASYASLYLKRANRQSGAIALSFRRGIDKKLKTTKSSQSHKSHRKYITKGKNTDLWTQQRWGRVLIMIQNRDLKIPVVQIENMNFSLCPDRTCIIFCAICRLPHQKWINYEIAYSLTYEIPISIKLLTSHMKPSLPVILLLRIDSMKILHTYGIITWYHIFPI